MMDKETDNDRIDNLVAEGEAHANAGDDARADAAFVNAENSGSRGANRAAQGRAATTAQAEQAKGPPSDDTGDDTTTGNRLQNRVSQAQRRQDSERSQNERANNRIGNASMREEIRDKIHERFSEGKLQGKGSHSAGVMLDHTRTHWGKLGNESTPKQAAVIAGLGVKMKVAGSLDNAEGMQEKGYLGAVAETAGQVASGVGTALMVATSFKMLGRIVQVGLNIGMVAGLVTGGTGTAAALSVRAGLKAGLKTAARKLARVGARKLTSMGGKKLTRAGAKASKKGFIRKFMGRRAKGLSRALKDFCDGMDQADRAMGGVTLKAEAAVVGFAKGGTQGMVKAVSKELIKDKVFWKNSWIGKAVGAGKDGAIAAVKGTKKAGVGTIESVRKTQRFVAQTQQHGVRHTVVDPARQAAINRARGELKNLARTRNKIVVRIGRNARAQQMSTRRYVAGQVGKWSAKKAWQGTYLAGQGGMMVGGLVLKTAGRASMAGITGVNTGQPVRAASIGVLTDELKSMKKSDGSDGVKAGHAIEKGQGRTASAEAKEILNFKPPQGKEAEPKRAAPKLKKARDEGRGR